VTWRTSTHSNIQACVEVGWRTSTYTLSQHCVETATFRTSTYSMNAGACVEAGQDDKIIGVRDTKDRNGPVLEFSPAAWRKFLLNTVDLPAYSRLD
jgi:Domain of unknown function (DUF397)